jgi:hypothetical protein
MGNLAISHLEDGRDGRIVLKGIIRTSWNIIRRALIFIN